MDKCGQKGTKIAPKIALNSHSHSPSGHSCHSHSAEVGSELTFTVQASDPEGGQLTLDWEPFGLPDGITLTPVLPFTGPSPVSSIFSWIPTINDVTNPGTVLIIRFGVRDEDGNIAGCKVQIEVIDTPPWWWR